MTDRTRLSVFITTYNNGRTLTACLESIKWADEIILLDSFSTDDTLAIAQRYGARVSQHKFMGYGPQKRMALAATTHHWVLLLDADEALSPMLQTEIRQLLERGPAADGYEIPRQEQMFWRMYNPATRMNHYLRLFDKRKGEIDQMPIHAAPKVHGAIVRLKAPLYHYGETDIHTKVEKINAYSTGLVMDKLKRQRWGIPLIMLLYPPLFFVRSYLFKRNFLNGWAGFINSAIAAFYVFLKYAKLYEHHQFAKYGTRLLPDNAPPLPSDHQARPVDPP
ncbi:MAG TPA: glycosyltransferase family 2 protein [Candidatus Competibacteraceae bacterium]|nr:MAG: glycosyltransferase family 2 protein [Candidatus Competibacteraceae bacterium]HOB61835.1 glycosyltransferase family 2 protein [Candidatus Competibacteraceae bacterium]HQA27289.1 glycosyltransferase family 2 protein [Candidatus Competibacteraceae bacterium]HQD56069.1 glycosyltransferase family 2 protein [Candidatus Competibacteraceae bacterium]